MRAAEDAGWRAEREHTLLTRTRPDALIHGLWGSRTRPLALTWASMRPARIR